MIPYGRQDISNDDIEAVVEILRSDFLTQGPVVSRFEEAVALYCGAKYGVAANSATSALHVACLSLDLGPGDWLWTSPNTFVASANCARYCGAKVDFVDIDPRTYNLCPIMLEKKLQWAKKNGALPKIVMPVHFSGQPCDMPAIHSLAVEYGFKIIEDASHAIGASYNKIKVGSCRHSDITVFSFHPVKIITTGEGGMAMTNDSALARRMSMIRSHGVTRDAALMKLRPVSEIWNYQQVDLGFNYRLTDIQAALGLSQMARIDEFIKCRHEIAARYDKALAPLQVTTPWQAPQNYSSYHLYPICIVQHDLKKNQKAVYDALWENGIAANIHYIPVHRHPYWEAFGYRPGDFPIAEDIYQKVLSLPIYPTMKLEQQSKVIEVLENSLKS